MKLNIQLVLLCSAYIHHMNAHSARVTCVCLWRSVGWAREIQRWIKLKRCGHLTCLGFLKFAMATVRIHKSLTKRYLTNALDEDVRFIDERTVDKSGGDGVCNLHCRVNGSKMGQRLSRGSQVCHGYSMDSKTLQVQRDL
jgi:hypothetical protein